METEFAIVGAGIGGIYSANLLKNSSIKKILLFEETDQIGGRLISPNAINLGAGRFCPAIHPRLNNLINQYSLPVRSFKFDIFFNLHKSKFFSLKESLEKLNHHKINKTRFESFYNEAISCLGPIHAKNLFITSGYDTLKHKDLSFEMGLKILQEHPETYVQAQNEWLQLQKGFQTLPIALSNTFKDKKKEIFLNTSLKKIAKENNKYRLTFQRNKEVLEVICSTVILAMPMIKLMKIDMFNMDVNLKNEFFPVPLFKCYLTYNENWYPYELEGKCLIVNNPLRKIYFDTNGNIFFYVDFKSANFWKKFISKSQQDLFEQIAIQLSKSIGISKELIPMPDKIHYQLWNPGISLWKKDSNFHGKVDNMLELESNIFLCSDIFTDYSGWIEGSLISAETIHHSIMKR